MLRSTLRYERVESGELSVEIIETVFSSDGPDVLHVKGTVPQALAEAARRELGQTFRPYEAPATTTTAAPPILHAGAAMYEHRDSLDDYLRNSAQADRELADQYPITDAVVELLVHRFRAAWPHGTVAVCPEPGRGRHRRWIARSMPTGTGPHRDNATEEAPGLFVGRDGVERAVNLYLSNQLGGGELELFAVQPRTGEPHALVSGTDRFGLQTYAAATRLVVPIEACDLTVFDPSLVHAVLAPVDERVALAFFLKRIGDDLYLRT
jgi:hypothetical protein